MGRLVSLGNGILPRGAVYEVRATAFSIGRASTNDIVIDSNLIAPVQLCLSTVDGGVHVTNADGAPQSLRNSQPISGTEPLRDGDRLDLSVESFLYREEATEALDSSPTAAHRFMVAMLSEMLVSVDSAELAAAALDAACTLLSAQRTMLFTFDPDGRLHQQAARAAGGVELSPDQAHAITPLLLERVHEDKAPTLLLQREVLASPPRDRSVRMICFVPMRAFHPHTGRRSLNGMIYAECSRPVHAQPRVVRPMLQMLGQLFTLAYSRTVGTENDLAQTQQLRRSRDALKHQLSDSKALLVAGDLPALEKLLDSCRSLLDF